MGKSKHKGVKRRVKLKRLAKQYKNKMPEHKRPRGSEGTQAKKEKNKKKKKGLLGAPGSAAAPQPPQAEAAEGKSPAAGSAPPPGGSKLKGIHKQLQTALARMYRPKEPILLLGEGNLSFAKALCRGPLGGDGSAVIATNLDPEAVLFTKYPDAKANSQELEGSLDATVLCGVDGCRIHEVAEFQEAFMRIVWNFPHSGSGEKDMERNVAEHQELLSRFFASAAQCLKRSKQAEIHVTLKEGQPYRSWKIVKVAQLVAKELRLKNALPFLPEAWAGYEHRRTLGFDEKFSARDSEELRKGAKTYVFGWTAEALGD